MPPCKICLCLPMCKIRAKRTYTISITCFRYCDILRDYVYKNGLKDEKSTDRLKKARKALLK